jgi:DNA-binding winged helix-turn-helix (wHTH) protein/tetratricopeptide (TPR) repeat protein
MVFAFGEFELDVVRRVLRRGRETIAVQPKVFDTLRYLIEHRERVVTKDELLEAIWDGQRLSGVVVPWTIRHARRALGQQGTQQEPIATVRRLGYRFASEVHADAGKGSPLAQSEPPRASGDPLLGRDDVMGRLLAAFDEAMAGRGSLCLLVGEAGIGKTRCVQELVAHARRAGIVAWTGRCAATRGAPAFWPWIQILRESSEDRRVVGPERSALGGFLDRLVPRELPAVQALPASMPPSDASRFWLADAIARALQRTAKKQVRVLVVEDLHAADDGSIELLALLAPHLASAQMLVVATSRDDAGARLSNRLRPCETVNLTGLGVGDVERLLTGAVGPEVPRELARYLQGKTSGNPLFLKEAVRVVAAQHAIRGSLKPADLAIPEVERGFLRERLAALDPQTRKVVDAASVLGEEFELPIVKRVVDLPTDVLAGCVDEAIRSRFIERASAGETYTFAHALVRDAVYEALPVAERLRLHGRVASALEASAAIEQRWSAIAHHLHHALPEANPRDVERYSRLAGDAAMRVFAYASAAELYDWALAAHGYDETRDVRVTCELFMSAAYAERQAARVPKARAHCERAIEIARREGFGDLLVTAAGSLRPTVWLAPVPDRLVLEALEHAERILPADAKPARARLYGLLATIPPYSSIERARELGGDAVRLAREVGDRSLLVEELARTLPANTGPDATDALLATTDEIVRLDGDPPSWWTAEAFLARYFALAQRSDRPGATRALEAFGECTLQQRNPEAIWQYERLCAQEHIYTGEYDRAEARFHELFTQSEGFREHAMAHYAAQMNALAWERTGRPLLLAQSGPGSGGGIDLGWRWAADIPSFRAERIAALFHAGEAATARAEFEEIARDDLRAVTRDLGYLYTLARLAHVAVGLGLREHAARLYEVLSPYATFSAIDPFAISLGPVAHFLGTLATSLGRAGAAVRHFEDAIATSERLGHAGHARRSRSDLAALRPRFKSA